MPQDSIPQMLALAIHHHHARQWPQAEALCRQILHQQPDHVEALHLLGHTLRITGRLTEAIDVLASVVALQPGHGSAHANLAAAWQARGEASKAIEAYTNVLALRPDSVPVLNNLGILLQATGRHPEAEQCYQRVLALDPDNADAWCNLGSLRCAQGQAEAGIDACRKAIALRPDHAQAHYNLSLALSGRQRPDEALHSCRQAIRLKPDFADAHTQLGNIHKEQGRLDEAIDCYRRALELQPGRHDVYSNLLVTLQAHPTIDSATLVSEHLEWARRYAEPLRPHIRPHENDRSPDRRLRIGYVSAYLRENVVSNMLEGLFAHHDHRTFEITVYSDARRDERSEQLKTYCELWHDTKSLTDEQLAEQVRRDGIDLLVDLGVHSGGNRLLAFARKPAPVQASYLGYAGTTGLSAIEYRLTDSFMSPPEHGGADGVEKLARLPNCYWCYTAPRQAPPVHEPPAIRQDHVTFGSLNDFAKVNGHVVRLWAEVLHSAPQSRLLLVIKGGPRNAHVCEEMRRHGVERSRLKLHDHATYLNYWDLYSQVDIALDPFPYNGGVTTLDSLYMGVPVVTLAGNRPLARAGVSILSNLGLPELIAQTPQHYVQIAAELASDLPRLAELRRTLRQRMQHSPLMDGPRFARGVEALYRQMWRTWALAGQ